jgi:CheY-like chemotaxis protein
MQPKILYMNGLVADIGKMLQRMIGEDIELVTTLDPGLGKVKADQSQIEQVIMNLAVNARDAMPEGGKLTIQTSNVELGEDVVASQPYVQPGTHVLLAVTDSGTGMDEATLAHIFEPFFTTKEKGKGTGLGLATVYGVVKQSGGYVWVDSQPGKGASFKIYLPVAVKIVQETVLEKVVENSPRGSETILLVEDEESLRALISDLLGQAGYKVLAATCGVQAIDIAEKFKGPIHMMLSDVVMPGIGGPAIAKKLESARPDMKVLFMSGYIEFRAGENGGLPPGTQLLQKPFTNDSLIREVVKVLKAGVLQSVS